MTMTNEELRVRLAHLEAERDLLQALADTMPDFIFAKDLDGQFVFSNRAHLHAMGVKTQADVLGKTDSELFPNELGEKYCAEDKRIVAGGEPVIKREEPVLAEDGTEHWISSTKLPWRDHAGEVVGIFGICRDITDYKRALEENRRWVEELEQRVTERNGDLATFRSMAENSKDVIFMIDPDFNFVYANKATYEVYGYDYASQEIMKLKGPDFWPEEALPFLQEVVVPRMTTESYSGEGPQKRKDGTRFPVDFTAFPIRDAEGKLTHVAVIVRDITEQKLAQKSLKESQQMLQLIMDHIPQAVFWKDRDLVFMGCNQEFAKDAGVDSPEDLIGKNDFDMPWRAQAELYRADDSQVMESGVPKLNYEEPHDMPDGQQNWMRVSKVPLRDADGRVIAVLGMYDDVTDIKRAEVERQRLQQQVIDAQRRVIQELSTPVIPVMEQVIVMPLVGSIDTMRARDITRTLLDGIHQHRAKVVILDVTGVPIVDSGVANHLNKTIQAARLKGAHTIITGISDAVAEAVVDLGIDWSDIETLSDLQTGLIRALNSLGIRLTRI